MPDPHPPSAKKPRRHGRGRARGRGRRYSLWRAILESALRVLYRGDWPARLWGALPLSRGPVVVRHRATLPPGAGRSCRLAFVSDLHVGPTTPTALLDRAFAVIRDAAPDVLLLGGDYVFLDADPRRLAELRRLVESVDAPTKLAVLGNHDLWADDAAIADTLTAAGARVLVNESVALPAPWSDVAVVGLDDPGSGDCDPGAARAQLNGEPFRLVLCHSPDGLRRLDGMRFDLCLSGHTHGGQIAAPWGPLVLPYGRLCRDYPSGFGRFGSGVVYVSRGVGAVELPIRTFAPPDVLLLDLVRPGA